MSACSSGVTEPVEASATTTVESSTSENPTKTTKTTESNSATTEASSTGSSAEPAPATTAAATCGAVGYTSAPGHESPHCLGKQIASCGTASHQTGTTFFTDGTSGWTQTCQDQMMATYMPPPPAPSPTFDPDSADGFGPDQELPPACLQLEGVDC